MTIDAVSEMTNNALYVIIKVSLRCCWYPGCCLVISIFQTVTSIQEQTLTFVPKIRCHLFMSGGYRTLDG